MFGISALRKMLIVQRSVEFVLPAQYREKDSDFDYRKAMNDLNKAQVRDNDIRLIALIRNYYIENPSTKPYKLNNPKTMDPSQGQVAVIDRLLNKKVWYINKSFAICRRYNENYKPFELLFVV